MLWRFEHSFVDALIASFVWWLYRSGVHAQQDVMDEAAKSLPFYYWNLTCPLEWSKYSCVRMENMQQANASLRFALLHYKEIDFSLGKRENHFLKRRVWLVGDSLLRQVFISLSCMLYADIDATKIAWADEEDLSCARMPHCIPRGQHSRFAHGGVTWKQGGEMRTTAHDIAHNWKNLYAAYHMQKHFQLTADDVIVISAGVHNKVGEAESHYSSYREHLSKLAENLKILRSDASFPKIVYAFTPAQHFNSVDGLYEHQASAPMVEGEDPTAPGTTAAAEVNSDGRRRARALNADRTVDGRRVFGYGEVSREKSSSWTKRRGSARESFVRKEWGNEKNRESRIRESEGSRRIDEEDGKGDDSLLASPFAASAASAQQRRAGATAGGDFHTATLSVTEFRSRKDPNESIGAGMRLQASKGRAEAAALSLGDSVEGNALSVHVPDSHRRDFSAQASSTEQRAVEANILTSSAAQEEVEGRGKGGVAGRTLAAITGTGGNEERKLKDSPHSNEEEEDGEEGNEDGDDYSQIGVPRPEERGCSKRIAHDPRARIERELFVPGLVVDAVLNAVDFMPLGDLHIGPSKLLLAGASDCSHYCMPGAPDVSAAALVAVVDRLFSTD